MIESPPRRRAVHGLSVNNGPSGMCLLGKAGIDGKKMLSPLTRLMNRRDAESPTTWLDFVGIDACCRRVDTAVRQSDTRGVPVPSTVYG